MANHKSSLKRIRQTESRRLRNRYYAKTARNAVRNLRKMTDKAEAESTFRKVGAMLDRLASKKAISKNKAANLKSKLAGVRFSYGLLEINSSWMSSTTYVDWRHSFYIIAADAQIWILKFFCRIFVFYNILSYFCEYI